MRIKSEDAYSVAIILVNYNGFEDTVECVKSVLNNSYTNYKIFLVDNKSIGSDLIEQSSFLQKHTYIILNDENKGFSGGNNVALQIAIKEKFDYALLINNDTIVDSDFLKNLMIAVKRNSNIGIATCKIKYYDEPDLVWSAGGEYNIRTGITTQYCSQIECELDVEKKITFATGCLMLIPIEVIKKVGFMSDEYFLYSEDTDYCMRVIGSGYDILYVPEAVIYHKVSKSMENNSVLKQRYMIRNNLYIIAKYSKNKQLVMVRYTFYLIKLLLRKKIKSNEFINGYKDYIKKNTGRIE